jgi:hypothetical protein
LGPRGNVWLRNAGCSFCAERTSMIMIPVITERYAGIDVGKRVLAAAVAVRPANKEAEIKPWWFGTTVPGLEELRAWLR